MFRIFCIMTLALCAAVCVAQEQVADPPAQEAMTGQIMLDVSVNPEAGLVGSVTIDDKTTKKTYASILEICEALPRKPEADDNELAAMLNKTWLEKNVYGCTLRTVCKVAECGTNEQNKTMVWLAATTQKVTWRGYPFEFEFIAFLDPARNDLAKLRPGNEVTIEGRIADMQLQWGSQLPVGSWSGGYGLPENRQKTEVNVELRDCTLIAQNGEPATQIKPAFASESLDSSPLPKCAAVTPEKPEVPMEIVSTSASDMEIRRLKVPDGWLVFTKWFVKEAPGTPDHTETMSVFCPDPQHRWNMPGSSVQGNVKTGTALEQVGKQLAPTPPLRPLGNNLMVDKNGIIWDQGQPVGIWGIDSGNLTRLRGTR